MPVPHTTADLLCQYCTSRSNTTIALRADTLCQYCTSDTLCECRRTTSTASAPSLRPSSAYAPTPPRTLALYQDLHLFVPVRHMLGTIPYTLCTSPYTPLCTRVLYRFRGISTEACCTGTERNHGPTIWGSQRYCRNGGARYHPPQNQPQFCTNSSEDVASLLLDFGLPGIFGSGCR